MLGFQQGDKEGKRKVDFKRSRQVIEKEISQKTDNLHELTAFVDRKIKLLRSAQEDGQSPASIKQEAKKAYDLVSAGVDTNSYESDYKGMGGDKLLEAKIKDVKKLQASLEIIMKDGNVQKI